MTDVLMACKPSTFSPSVHGAEILSIAASVVTNFNYSAPSWARYVAPTVEVENESFCNVTVTYTHPGQNDTINVETWLPTENWNKRLQAVGGGGFSAGRNFLTYMGMAGAMAEGYVTITTDAGLGINSDSELFLVSPGNVNLYLVQDFASVSLNDEVFSPQTLLPSDHWVNSTRPSLASLWPSPFMVANLPTRTGMAARKVAARV